MFHSPWAFALLPLVPWLAWRMWRASRSRGVAFSDLRFAADLRPSWRQRLAWLPAAFTLLALTLMIIALARPRAGREQTVIDSEGIAIELVVDRSGSMQAMDFRIEGRNVNRLTAIKNVAGKFVLGGIGEAGFRQGPIAAEDRLQGRYTDLIGLISFAGYADPVAPPTLDHRFLVEQLNRTEIVKRRSEDGTALGDAISLAVEKLTALDAGRDETISKVMIVLTDGENNAGDFSPEQAAQLADTMGIKIYTIGIGTKGLAPFPVTDPFSGRQVFRRMEVNIDEATLTEIAETTGGEYFRATDTASLESIYEAIDRMEKTKLEAQHYVDYREWAVQWLPVGGWFLPPLVLVALLLLLGRITLRATLFRQFA